MSGISKSLDSAPVLESLPSTVFQVQADLSTLGSKLSDLVNRINSVENDLHQSLAFLNQTLGSTVKAQQVKYQNDNVCQSYNTFYTLGRCKIKCLNCHFNDQGKCNPFNVTPCHFYYPDNKNAM